MTKRSKAPKDTARKAVLMGEALTLRIKGLSFEDIGAKLGIARSTAHGYVIEALEQRAAENAEKAAELRELESERMDAAIKSIYPKVEKGDLAAIDRLVRLADRRARFYGLDAPKRHHVTGGMLPDDVLRGMSDDDLERLAKGEPLTDE